MKVNNVDKIDIACNNFKKVRDKNKTKFEKIENWLEKESNNFLKFGINIGTELSHTHFAIVINSDDSTSNDNITVIPIFSKNGYKRIPLKKILLKAISNTKIQSRLLCSLNSN